jgi:tetratricopeptide (TPR) repeat protein
MALPEYMIALGFQKEFLRVGINLWRKKAEAREAVGDLKGAIKAYEAEIQAFENYVIYASYKPMLKAADCYEKLGELSKATELRAKAAVLQRTRIR